MHLVKTLLADNHRIFLEGLKTVLKNDPHFQHKIVGCTPSGQRLLELWQEHQPDLLIMDLNLIDKHGLEVIERIVQGEQPKPRILLVTAYQDPKILRAALDQGADGYLSKYKGVPDLYEAVEEVLAGNVYRSEPLKQGIDRQPAEKNDRNTNISEVFIKKHRLTKRETQILALISQALSNKEIGRKLFISDQTVSVHRKNIMRKLGVKNTAGLIKMAYEHSL